MKKEECQKLANELSSLPENIRAEVIAAGLLAGGLSREEMQTENAGSFSRPYRKDVLAAAAVETAGNAYALRLQLSRDGLYDLLPEGVVHGQQVEQGKKQEVKSLTEGYKKRKQEEASARKFFRPLEQEVFFQGVQLEQKELELLGKLRSVFFRFLSDFWGISGAMPARYEEVLLRLLPHMHGIAGDFEKIRACLEKILEVPVAFQQTSRTLQFKSGFNRLGKGKLGDSFTLGSCIHALPGVHFIIGPVRQEELIGFLPGGAVDLFIQQFFAYTIPLEAEVTTQVLARPVQDGADGKSFGRLGYSARL